MKVARLNPLLVGAAATLSIAAVGPAIASPAAQHSNGGGSVSAILKKRRHNHRCARRDAEKWEGRTDGLGVDRKWHGYCAVPLPGRLS